MNRIETDVVIVGTGAGGGTAAEILAHAGFHVTLVEEGPFRTAADFHMLEREAYPQLYQESAARKTKDKGITILQGRAVGGSTTVNWTASFRTPPQTLDFWNDRFGVEHSSESDLAPWFSMMERRLNIHPWDEPANENNAVLRAGAARLGVETGIVPRNVKQCVNLGYCGMGCPVNAKQSMLVTTIPSALQRGAKLVSGTRAERLVMGNGRVEALECRRLGADGITPTDEITTIHAQHYILAAGAIGTPAILLRSNAPDPAQLVGKRTFLHPVVLSAALMPQAVNAFSGAPQSIYSDHFLNLHPLDGPLGYKLEVPPVHPLLAASTIIGFGRFHAQLMQNIAQTQVIIALIRDGFHPESQGGTVELNSDGTPVLDYPITAPVWEAARRALKSMAQIQFAGGAKAVLPMHEDAHLYGSLAEAESAIEGFPMEILRTRVVSAHVMGGCPMGEDLRRSVVDSFGAHHALANLSIFDGSIFPTSVGTNPQLSIYGFTARNATHLAQTLKSAGSSNAQPSRR